MFNLHKRQKRPEPWNKGKLAGQKLSLTMQEIWSIRKRLQAIGDVRALALFNLDIDSKLRACDLPPCAYPTSPTADKCNLERLFGSGKRSDRSDSRSRRGRENPWKTGLQRQNLPTPRTCPPDPEYPYHDRTVRVTRRGRICFGRLKVNLSTVFSGQLVGLREVEDHV